MHMLAYPLLGTGRGASIRRRAVEQAVTCAGVDHDRPILASLLLDGLERGDALNRRHVSIGPAEEPEDRNVQPLEVRLWVEARAVERGDLLGDLSLGRAWLVAIAPARVLLELGHDAVLEDAWARDRDEGT
jgi:hypothetical protein